MSALRRVPGSVGESVLAAADVGTVSPTFARTAAGGRERRRSACGVAPALLLRRVLAGRATARPCDAPGGLDIDLAGTDDARAVEPEQRDLRPAGILRAGTGPQLFGLAARSEVCREALGVGSGGQADQGREDGDAEARETSDHAGPLVTEPAGGLAVTTGRIAASSGRAQRSASATEKARRTSLREADPTGLIVWLRGQDLNL